MAESTFSAVLVTVPEAERVVRRHRERFDPAALAGVPAHVTVMYPFVPPGRIDDDVLAAVADAVVTVPRFRAEWRTTSWFGDQLLWVAPEPASSFNALTTSVMDAFPGYLPYEGEHGDPVPHLTVGDRGSQEELRAAEREIMSQLPFTMDVTAVQVMCGANTPGSWHTIAEFPLGPAG
ncbi:2'-5' RNA ligase family protein [Phytoactinopolyspora mesophila]|uniref:2'-5' RNA ligase family protein n=1 Tax=Phytoactinopolyspora mesophila TaxID=2650750 RepID=A0A7K3M008_9ACTN|nr:2'-5' RNA ligase family protein [Phytoactinopolyspora mesophila]NDL56599.1 2'-5' RNA ligase family protein [Phytoactinopolyspora mesophila]